MSDDKENILDVAQSHSRNWTGEGKSHAQMLDEFKLHSISNRVEMLNQFDSEYKEMEVSSDAVSLRKFADYGKFRSDAQTLHHRLRKAGR